MKKSSDKSVPMWLGFCQAGLVVLFGSRGFFRDEDIPELGWTAILVAGAGLIVFGLMVGVTEVLSRRRRLTLEIQKEKERLQAAAATRASS